MPDSKSDGPRINRFIQAQTVRLIDPSGEMIGVLPLSVALKEAERFGLDLVEISPNSSPPVCKILDHGKYKYELQKKKSESKKKQKVTELKEIQMRPTIDLNDFEVKSRAVRKFLAEGNKVKITIRFRGREVSHQELGANILNRLKDELSDIAKIESQPKLEGKQLTMVVAYKSSH